ncbi:MAG: glycosyltransferase [Chloroflexi bacterium]|nr:glycosyltransferase [Chloroflexota bacterium]
MLHVLMISLDTALATQPHSATRRRHCAYAERAGSLTVVAYTPPGAGGVIQASPHLTILPTNSRHPLLFALDAARRAETFAASHVPVHLITTQDPFVTGLVGVWLRDRLGVPLLVQNHSYYFGNRAWLAERPLRNRALTQIGRLVRGRADFYRTVNRRERATYVNIGGELARSAVLPLGTASAQFAATIPWEQLAALRADLGLAPDDRVVLWVGYPVAFKRVPLLLRTFRRVLAAEPDARLLLVGDMAQSPDDLAALARAEGIAERTLMIGPVAHEDLPAYYALADVYAITSAYEGLPRVLFEAAAAGLPLAGMRTPGVDEAIRDWDVSPGDANGLLVPDGDTDALAAAILKLLRDPALRQRLGAQGRTHALAAYDADAYLDAWVDLWRRAVALGRRT